MAECVVYRVMANLIGRSGERKWSADPWRDVEETLGLRITMVHLLWSASTRGNRRPRRALYTLDTPGLSSVFLVSTFDPRNARSSERVSDCGLKFKRLPFSHGIQMPDELWEQANAEAPNRAASLITGLMLVEPQIRVACGLPYIEAPPSNCAGIAQQNDID
jgi:hypothetical protein